MAVNVAFTSPVNKPGQEPYLSAEDVWSGILDSVRRPEEFVDYIAETEILEDTGLALKRILHFVPGGSHGAPGGRLEQDITIVPEFKVEFVAATTGKATLMVSNEADIHGSDGQVYMTQCFEVAYPEGVAPGSEAAVKQFNHLSGVARRNVLSNIQSFRDLKSKKP
ncbi:uncharacterized protein PG998_014936 [Apiospora kogelbergensis]|uniref:uncharacterized protein n=1 Tax=Apiospora kogelbergensis TaxID=1337665 RepID=UPI003131E720